MIKFTEKYLSRYLAIGFAQVIITLIKENWTTLRNIGKSRQPDYVKVKNIAESLFSNFGNKIRNHIPQWNRKIDPPRDSRIPRKLGTIKIN